MTDLTNINDIRALLARHGFKFSKALGQNFLTAAWVPERIADAAGLDTQTGVLEIGPGIGCLTEQLAMRAGKVVSVELDERLLPILNETLSGRDNAEIVYGDVLALDIKKLVDEKMPGMRHTVCANLPYNVTGPVITRLSAMDTFESMTLMVQREAAVRICASPGGREYGAFTVLVQRYCDCERLFDVPPDCFVPRPKVTSSVIKLTRRERPENIKNGEMFERVVKGAFSRRRKTLLNSLSSFFPSIPKEELEKTLINCRIDPKRRAETLKIGEFAKIADSFCDALAQFL